VWEVKKERNQIKEQNHEIVKVTSGGDQRIGFHLAAPIPLQNSLIFIFLKKREMR